MGVARGLSRSPSTPSPASLDPSACLVLSVRCLVARAFKPAVFGLARPGEDKERRRYVSGRAAMRPEGVWSEPAGKQPG